MESRCIRVAAAQIKSTDQDLTNLGWQQTVRSKRLERCILRPPTRNTQNAGAKLTGVCDGLEQGRVVDCRGGPRGGGSTDGEATAGLVVAREVIIHGETVVASVDVAVGVCVGRVIKSESLGLVGESSSGRRRGRGAAHGEAPAVGRAREFVHYGESRVACDGAASASARLGECFRGATCRGEVSGSTCVG